MKNVFGTALTLTLFGESHGAGIGAVIDGLAPGLAIDEEFIDFEMSKRRATGTISTARKEKDEVEILSGYFNGFTTGTPLALLIRNTNTRSKDYSEALKTPRPGHADYAASKKYLGFEDYRGGGHFSGRITAPLVAAGAICRMVLAAKGITIATHLAQCASIDDEPLPYDEKALKTVADMLNKKMFAVLSDEQGEKMQQAILDAKTDKDSVGGILETFILGLPAGLGEPFFGSVESVLAQAFFSIPAVKGVQFGAGFGFATMRGSVANDAFISDHHKGIKTKTNNNGGLNGGITNGMPIVLQAVVKPTPSIAKKQQTLNFATNEQAELEVVGRHDPCILHRARAVADAMSAFSILDLISQQSGTLGQLHK